MPKISVIMPIYNIEEKYLRQSIESILNQTFVDFEFIIINDGSTNNSPYIIREYAKKDSRIKIIKGEHNGISSALNKGLSVACGEFVARMDGDDVALPNRFAIQVKYLDEHKEVSLLGSQIKKVPNGGTSKYAEDVSYLSLIKDCPLAHPTVMFRKADFEKYDLRYDETFPVSEDYELWSRVVRHLKILIRCC